MKETTKAYMAGLIDAEGSYTLSRHETPEGYIQFDPLIRFTTTHLPTMKWVVKTFGGVYRSVIWKEGGWKPYYQWRIGNDKEAYRFLILILPYVWMKKDEALVLKKYYDLQGAMLKDERESLFNQMTELKKRKSVTTNTPDFLSDSKATHAYIAGIFDGEGTAYIIKHKQQGGRSFGYRASIAIGNTYKPLIDLLYGLYGGVVRSRPPHNGVLTMHEWEVKRNGDKERFVLAILPYIIIKRQQARAVLEFIRLGGERDPLKREAFRVLVCELNGKKIESELHGDMQSAPTVTLAA